MNVPFAGKWRGTVTARNAGFSERVLSWLYINLAVVAMIDRLVDGMLQLAYTITKILISSALLDGTSKNIYPRRAKELA